MTKTTTFFAVVLREALGWLLLFTGIEKLLNPEWTAQGFLLAAKTFPDLYAWFAAPAQLSWVDPLNAWGLALVGAALVLGVFVRPAAWAGALLMLLYYFPQVAFPAVAHGYVVDEHIVYAAAFLLLASLPAARRFGLGNALRGTFLGRIPLLRSLI